jgi:hypothetical protein
MWRRVDLVWTDVSEEHICFHLQDRKIRERGTSVSRWLQSAAYAGSSLADFPTLKMEAITSSETSVHTRSTRLHIPEDGILQNYVVPTWAFFILLERFNKECRGRRNVGLVGKTQSVCGILVTEREDKSPFERLRGRSGNNVKTYVGEIGWMWTLLKWVLIGSSRILWTLWWILGIHNSGNFLTSWTEKNCPPKSCTTRFSKWLCDGRTRNGKRGSGGTKQISWLKEDGKLLWTAVPFRGN